MQRVLIKLAAAVFTFILVLSAYTLSSRLESHFLADAQCPVEERWHRLYEAALMSGATSLQEEVSDRLLCANREGMAEAWPIEIHGQSWCQKVDRSIHELRANETSEYCSFAQRITSSHRSWAMRNLDFVRSVGTAKSARAYVRSHEWPPAQ